MNPAISGLWPALMHPLNTQGTLDCVLAIAHANAMLVAGCDGVTLFGTTGEGPAFSVSERMALLDAMLAAGVRADQMVVTISAVALPDAIALGRHALARGVQRQMLMPPFYFKQPRDAGIVQAVSEVVQGIGSEDLRLVLYHFPAISAAGFSHAAISELLQLHPKQIVGVKDSSADLPHTLGLVAAFPTLSVLVGAESHVAPVMRAGGAGTICGLANLAPNLMRRIVSAPATLSVADQQLMTHLLAVHAVLPGLPFVPVCKTMLAEQCGNDDWLKVRAPLCKLEPHEEQAVRQAYRAIADLLQAC
jgi:4-hydroxy-tetrahydrodipicolinate synthase